MVFYVDSMGNLVEDEPVKPPPAPTDEKCLELLSNEIPSVRTFLSQTPLVPLY